MKRDPLASLRIRDFRFFISARLFITLSTQMQAIIIQWQIYKYTQDPFWLGMIGLTEVIPFIGSSLFTGYVADIIERKKIIMASGFVLILLATALMTFTFKDGSFLKTYGVWPIYIVVFLSGLFRAFLFPASFAFFGQIVPRENYANASTWSSTAWQAGAIGGPLLVALFYDFLGITYTYAIDLGLIIIAYCCYMLIPSRPLPPRVEKEPLFQSIGKGVKFVFKNEIILGALSLDLFAVFFGGAVALLPMFADRMHAGVQGLSALRAAPSVGAVIMIVIMIYRPLLNKAGRNLLICVAGFGMCMICFALSRNLYLSFFILLLSGGFDSVSVVVRSTILQLMTPDEMRGRVSAVNNIFIGSSNEIGEFESGLAARIMTLVPSVIFGGAMTMLVVLYTTFKAKKLVNLKLEGK